MGKTEVNSFYSEALGALGLTSLVEPKSRHSVPDWELAFPALGVMESG